MVINKCWPVGLICSCIQQECSISNNCFSMLQMCKIHPSSTVWVKIPPPWNFLTFSPNSWEFLVHILYAYCKFLSTLDYKFLFNYLQLWRSYAILSTTSIMCSKCPPSTETHAGWSHLIWHNFITVGDNWIKICILAYIGTFNKHVKYGLKIPNCSGKMSENASMCFGRWWTLCAHDVNWVVTLNVA